MPIHDWTRVDAGVFHDFHNAWITHLSQALNGGLLPPDHYALGEPITGIRAETVQYTRRQRTLVIRQVSNHRIVAMVEIVSPGNKASRHEIQSLLDKTLAALGRGIHLLLIDLQPPSPRDPEGWHGLLWEQLTGVAHQQPPQQPLTLGAYDAGPPVVAYVETLAVGNALPSMPLFLAPDQYVEVPLEMTYLAAYKGVPLYYRNILTPPGREPNSRGDQP
jgi:hypothetical protein